jgi:hypothetical protein
MAAATAVACGDAGNHAFEFIRLPHEPVGRSLAGAHLASVGGAAALGWNPAGLAEAGRSVALAHATWADETAWEWAALSVPVGPGACGLSGVFFRSGALEGYTAEGVPTGDFSPTQLCASAGYGLPLRGGVSLGASLEAALENDGTGRTLRAAAVSFGAQFATDPVAFGVAALHVGPGLRVEETDYPLPTLVRAGATVRGLPGTLLHGAVDWVAGEAVGFRCGAEWSPVPQLRFLGGAGFASEASGDQIQPAAGAALDLGRTHVSYGFQSFAHVDASHQVAITLSLD